jgi:hypothetical protein
MMLAPTLAGHPPRTAIGRRWRATRSIALDIAVLGLAAAACAALFLEGGFEALLGGAFGAAFGARDARSNAVSGALGGLFVGAMFAGFFHGALAAFVTALL